MTVTCGGLKHRVAPTALGRLLAAQERRSADHASVGKFAVAVLLMAVVAVSAFQAGEMLGGVVFLLIGVTFTAATVLLRSHRRL
jgi:Flp pilus assembly protein TadB